ncbi:MULTISPECIES: hypothetical protein [unclassified Sphingobacterium]|uniref:hypothetical protein n=1 Tax=unclassified Sphingobacterium TaxID=2609468 RepID=UPI00104884B7|nr:MULTISPECIES: hypothetical protein [unclassified Sphingobacterium]MCS3554698.1 hypothetical protein [Sphingobacterium sp. JUb21]TCR07686.1 hypothetical protein EDF66_105319 [Sphingobacterium sp. JUb20]
MKFSISLTTDNRSQAKSGLIIDLSDKLTIFFADRIYGDSIQHYIIGFTCVCTPEGIKNLFVKKKPVYFFDKISTNRFTGEKIKMFRLFIDHITIEEEEYEDFVSGSDADSLELVKNKILESLSNLDKLTKSVKDFDKQKFKYDMNIILTSFAD